MSTSAARAVTANRLGALVLALGDRIDSALEDAAGQTGTSASALLVIAQIPGSSIEELRRAVGLSHSATVRAVDRLAAAGLVVRERAPRGPAVALHATAMGRDTARRLESARLSVLSEVVASVSGEKVTALSAVIDELLSTLTVDEETTSCRQCAVAACTARGCPVVARQMALGRAEAPRAEAL